MAGFWLRLNDCHLTNVGNAMYRHWHWKHHFPNSGKLFALLWLAYNNKLIDVFLVKPFMENSHDGTYLPSQGR